MMPKVLIAAPVAGFKQYSINQWFEWIANQEYCNYDVAVCCNGKGYAELAKMFREVDIKDIHGNNKKVIALELKNSEDLSVIQKITYSREKLRQYAVIKNYDYIFFLDTDTIPASREAIQKMVDKNLSVISGLYFYKHSKVPVVIDLKTRTNISERILETCYNNDEVVEVWGFGFGCLLLRKNVFQENPFNYELMKENFTDDFGYCKVLEDSLIKRWLYPKIICKHLIDNDNKQKTDIAIPIKFITTPKRLKEEESIDLNGKNKNGFEDKNKGVYS